jgi:hypothetical protein
MKGISNRRGAEGAEKINLWGKSRALCCVFMAMLLLVLTPALRADTIQLAAPVTYQVKDGPAQRVLGVQDGVLSYTSITSTTPGKVRQLKGVEFILSLKDRDLTPGDFQVTDVAQPGPGALDLTLSSENPKLDVVIHYRQDPESFFMRKWIEVKPRAASVFIRRITLEAFKPWETPETFSGPGQPVYVGDTFWGVAYPSADNALDRDGSVSCSYLVGLDVGAEGYVSPEAVMGVSGPGLVREAFYQYIDQVRARPARPFLLWNTWYDIFNYTDQEVIAGIEGLKKNLTDPYGIKLDAVVLDDGWDDFRRLWEPNRKRFPEGFGPVSEAAHGIGAELGLWMSPVGGYAVNLTRRILGALGQGYEKNGLNFCFAGKKYQAAFAERMVQYENDYKVNYFKLDNLSTICSSPFHGHRAGPYARAGLTDAFIAVLKEARAARPTVMINFTVGSWLSPWWLEYADVLWRGGLDFGFAGEGSPRQRNITYVDKILYQRLRVEQSQFPVSSLMTHGVIKGRRQSFGETGENLRDFSDDVWMYFSRGVMMQELYLSPDLLSEKEWQALAQAITFARENAAVLSSAEMSGGDPGKGEVYVFVHELGDNKILALRNPALQQQEIPEDLLRSSSACRIVYSSFSDQPFSSLAPLETRIISCANQP